MPQGAQKRTDLHPRLEGAARAGETAADAIAFRIVTRADFQKVSA